MKYIVIGNGFDLNLGLKTSYRDFMSSSNFQSLIASKNELAVRLEKQAKEEHEKFDRWVDIEVELSKYSGITSASVFKERDALKGNFDELKLCLVDYLSVAQDAEINKDSVAYRMMQEHFDETNLIYNFNYTDAALKVLNTLSNSDPLQDNEKHVFVHGSIKNTDIILGVQDDAKQLGNKHRFLKKSNNPNFGNANLLQVLNKRSDIVFFGHSFGVTDKAYFSAYFRQLIVQRGSYPTLIFYYYGESGLEELNSRLELYTQNRIADLRLRNKVKFIDSSGNEQ